MAEEPPIIDGEVVADAIVVLVPPLSIEERMARLERGYQSIAENMQWLVDNTKNLFAMAEAMQAAGGPAALLGLLGKG